MDFSHYADTPVELAIDLVNTQRSRGDSISTIEELGLFLDDYDELWSGVARPAAGGDLDGVHELRSSLRRIFTSRDQDEAVAHINEILTTHGAEPRLSAHDGDPHLHFEPIGSSMVDWLGAVTAMGLASVVVEHGIDRFGVCSSQRCGDVYVDTSRNRSRLHCSSTCSTREAVAAYRKRQAT